MDKISDEAARDLELKLKDDPTDLSSRLALLRYYFLCRSKEKLALRLNHIIWMIDNHSEHEISGTPYCWVIDKYTPEEVQTVKNHWLSQVDKFPKSSWVAGNAAQVLHWDDFELGHSLMQKAAELDPANKSWAYSLNQLCWLHIQYFPHDPKNSGYAKEAMFFGQRAIDLDEDNVMKLFAFEMMACSALYLNDYESAISYASQLDQMATKYHQDGELDIGHAIRGLVALYSGKSDELKNELLSMDPTHPRYITMRFAREMLVKGQTAAVLEFLSAFKKHGVFPEVTKLIKSIKNGEIPNMDFPLA